MAALRAPVDAFFEAVQVNSDNEIVRRNRLNLLSQVRNTCARVADLGRIEAAWLPHPASGAAFLD